MDKRPRNKNNRRMDAAQHATKKGKRALGAWGGENGGQNSNGGGKGKGNGKGRAPKNPFGRTASVADFFVSSMNASFEMRSFKVVATAFLLLAALFFFRLVFLQVIVAGEYSANAEESRTIYFETNPRRGTIYDRNGVVLAVSVDSYTVYCNPSEVTNAPQEASVLATVLGGDTADYISKLTQKPSTFVYLKRQIDEDRGDQLKEYKLDGVYLIEDSRREYPNGKIGAQVIGVCDVDGNGICGLELQYDEILRGTPGVYTAQRGEQGTPIPGGVQENVAAIDGEDIMISIDIRLQEQAEIALDKGIQEATSKSGSALVMDAATGEIYAACAYPFLDPNNLEESEIGSDNLIPITQAIEPGSMFKTVTAAAVLEEGKLEPEDTMTVPVALQADEYEITDAFERGEEEMTFREILARSSNVGISLAVDKIGFEALYDYILRMKFDQQTGVDFPGEGESILEDISVWSHIGGYNISFGQGLAITPVQLMRFYGAVAHDGIEASPHFLISKPQTNEWPVYATEKVITDKDALEKTRFMMRSVVQEGTGKGAAIDGYEVVGKTSTAEIAEDGGYAEDRYNHCFGGFIEHSNSALVCYTSVNNVVAANCASIFHDIMVEAIDLYNIVPN